MGPPQKKKSGGSTGPRKLPGRGMPRSAAKKRPIDEKQADQMRSKKMFHGLKMVRKALKEARLQEQRKLHRRIKQSTDESAQESDPEKKATLEKQATKFRAQLECSKDMDLDALAVKIARAKGLSVPEDVQFSTAPPPKKGQVAPAAAAAAAAAAPAPASDAPTLAHAREVLESKLVSSPAVAKVIEEMKQTLDKLERVLSSQQAGPKDKDAKDKDAKGKGKEKAQVIPGPPPSPPQLENEAGSDEDEEEPELEPVTGKKRKAAAAEEPSSDDDEEEEEDEEGSDSENELGSDEDDEDEGEGGMPVDIDALLEKIRAGRRAEAMDESEEEDLLLVDEAGKSVEATSDSDAAADSADEEEGEGAAGAVEQTLPSKGPQETKRADGGQRKERGEKKEKKEKGAAKKDKKPSKKPEKPVKPKNRPGQLKRRKLAELKFGAEAKHIREGQAPIDKRAAEKILGIKSDRPPRDSPVPASARDRREKPSGGGGGGGEGPLHASWEAKKKEKELMAAALKGGAGGASKKVVFEDDD